MYQANYRREEELVQQVEQAIKHLGHLGEPVTPHSITQLLGMSYQGIRIYPRVEALLMKAYADFHLSPQKPYLVTSTERRETILST